ncbi:hypothetical protein [Streptomyces phytophilus]|uniref:hypothetical protein n=1 Tax=Streptomyces phytophilus TaxID=722715 RepID=UPI0015EFF1D8|nr:hypothetical protein [Streptomyces phytophilus]
MRALDSKSTARTSGQVDRAVESASRDVDRLCHRRFYPQIATRFFDFPSPQYARPWRLWLDDSELISVTSLSSGGTAINEADFFLEPNRSGPPYSRVEIDLAGPATFGGGDTHQRDITLTGLFGYRNDETQAGTLAAAVASADATSITVDGPAAAALGVGSVLRLGAERLLVTARANADTGQNLGGDLTPQNNSVAVTVADGTVFAVDEVLLIGSERMLIVDIAGNTLTVKRGWDGSVLAAHTAGADVYAPRTLTVQRGALGTTAATHDSGAQVVRWDPPGPVRDLTLAEAVAQLTNEQTGYARTRRSGDGGSSERAMDATALAALRDRVYASHGRKARVRAV